MLDNLDAFVMEPAPQGATVKCRITRDRKGMGRGETGKEKSKATLRPDIKDTNHKQDFSNGTFVTLKQKYLSKPIQSESSWTN